MPTTPLRRVVEVPPEVAWNDFIVETVEDNARSSVGKKGELLGIHRLIVGKNGSGKTTLTKIFNRMKKAVLVFGTKPGRDASLEEYVEREGFLRIEHWPPKEKELRVRGEFGQVKLLLWPKITHYSELRNYAPMFRKAAEDIASEGRWTLSIDEGLWVCSNKGLNLGDIVSEIAYGGRSNGISLHLCVQRPSGIPIIIHDQCREGYVFKIGNTNDIREIASYSAYSNREVSEAVSDLGVHEFLHLPMGATDREWGVSEVPKAWS